LRIFICPWETIKNVASVAAVILAKFEFEHLPEKFVWHSDLTVLNHNFRPAVLRLLLFGPFFVDCLFHLRFYFIDLCTAVVSQFVFARSLLVDGGSAHHLIN